MQWLENTRECLYRDQAKPEIFFLVSVPDGMGTIISSHGCLLCLS